MLELLKSYNEMLFMFYKVIFIIIFIFYLLLVIYGYMLLVGINVKYIFFVKDYEEFIKWILIFGILLIVFLVFWLVISGVLDLYNNVVKIIGIRKMWDSYLIIKLLVKIVGVMRKLIIDEFYKVMSKLYYLEVKELKDKYYVEFFWNKVYYFWVFFEYIVIVFVIILIISIVKLINIFFVIGFLINFWLWIIFFVVFDFFIFIVLVKLRIES